VDEGVEERARREKRPTGKPGYAERPGEEIIRKGARCARQRGQWAGAGAQRAQGTQLPLLACSAGLGLTAPVALLASASAAASHGSFLPSAALLLQPYARARGGRVRSGRHMREPLVSCRVVLDRALLPARARRVLVPLAAAAPALPCPAQTEL
jgi:hypothetical protein